MKENRCRDYNKYEDTIVLIRKVGRNEKNYLVCNGFFKKVSIKHVKKLEDYILDYNDYLKGREGDGV